MAYQINPPMNTATMISSMTNAGGNEVISVVATLAVLVGILSSAIGVFPG